MLPYLQSREFISLQMFGLPVNFLQLTVECDHRPNAGDHLVCDAARPSVLLLLSFDVLAGEPRENPHSHHHQGQDDGHYERHFPTAGAHIFGKNGRLPVVKRDRNASDEGRGEADNNANFIANAVLDSVDATKRWF